jgi:hypothetical protein
MILHLIGPNDHFTVNYWMEDKPPAVIYNTEMDRVWVKASYTYGNNEHRYFEQGGARYLPQSFMTKQENPTLLQATEDDR